MPNYYKIQNDLDVNDPAISPFLVKEDKRRGYHTFNTRPLQVQFPSYLHEPRDFEDNKDFKFDVTALAFGEDAVAFKTFIDYCHDLVAANHPDVKRSAKADPPYVLDPEDRDGNVIEGAIAFKFKVDAQWKGDAEGDWTRQPTFYDYESKVMDPVNAGPGSMINLNFQLKPAFHKTGSKAGIRLEPKEVQVLKLVKRTGGGSRTGFTTRGEAPQAPAGGEDRGQDERRGDF